MNQRTKGKPMIYPISVSQGKSWRNYKVGYINGQGAIVGRAQIQ
jgi:hypothetical protein